MEMTPGCLLTHSVCWVALDRGQVAAWGGSWNFVFAFAVFIIGWSVINMMEDFSWDPYPFILLNLMLSMVVRAGRSSLTSRESA
jgi:hypothetical protein